jgi:hypothetical protein
MAMGSTTSGLYMYQNSGGGTPTGYLSLAFSISGTTVTWGTAVLITGSVTNTTATGTAMVIALTASTYLLQYFSAGSTNSQTLVVATVAGTVVSYGTAVTTGNSGASPVCRLWQYAAGVFIAAAQKLYPVAVSGTTITVGTVLDGTATASVAAQALDGTWFFSTTGGALGSITQSFTATATTITPTGVALAQFLADSLNGTTAAVLVPFTSSLVLGYYMVSGAWFTYAPILNAGSVQLMTQLSTNGSAWYLSATTAGYALTNYA